MRQRYLTSDPNATLSVNNINTVQISQSTDKTSYNYIYIRIKPRCEVIGASACIARASTHKNIAKRHTAADSKGSGRVFN